MSEQSGLGLTRQLRYLTRRIAGIDFARLWSTAGDTASDAGRRWRLPIFLDILYCSSVYKTAFQDYREWDFYLLNRRERQTYMTTPKSDLLALKLNQREYRELFADKSQFNVRFNEFLGREWLDVREASDEDVAAFVSRHGTVIAKVPDSLGGMGISKVEAAEIYAGDNERERAAAYSGFRARLIADRQFLLEQFITQHEEMSSLNPTSVNTLRMVSYFDGTKTHVLATVLKMGSAGAAVDNFKEGGMYTMLDESGRAHFPAFDSSARTYTEHPATGTPIVGFQVPLFEETLRFIDTLSRVVPEMPYVGWDIAIGPNGPLVVEGNWNSGVFQAKPSLSGIRTGLLPKYQAAIGF